VVQGGYQTYRRLVYGYLYDARLPHRLVALDGYTGPAKTDLLKMAAEAGAQVLDLEGLANHRGSLLGEMAEPQPSQKAFESRLVGVLARLDPARPVLVEAESSKIGERIIPPAVWAAMKAAPRIQVTAPAEARCDYLLQAYDDILSDGPKMREKLDTLRAHRSHAVVDGWLSQIAAGDKAALPRSLMCDHYDLAYEKSRRRIAAQVLAEIDVPDLRPEGGLSLALEQILAALETA
jgi:tRNA 2-selenouridine synthase